MGFVKAILSNPHILFGVANRLVKPVRLPISRFYSTQDDIDQKKVRKLAKKLAVAASEPRFYQARSSKWTELKKRYDQEVASKEQEVIHVTLLDGKVVEGFSWDLTPLQIAQDISHALVQDVYIAKINDQLWDFERPLEADCKIQLLKYDSQDAKTAFWTTAAFTLAEALERLYCTDDGGVVCSIGSTQSGFYADIHLTAKTINRKDIGAIDEQIAKILQNHSKVERIETTKSDANELFAYNPFKLKVISERVCDRLPIYRCGCFIEIVDTPLLRKNKNVNTIKILKMESVLCNGQPIQRVHGVAFPSHKELKDYLKQNKLT
ncbi:threonine--tRNA ligase, cytoplasmic-like [Bradysia coprophila]|uniref:threonine--tRNA ligase, cytoplasmic-like n=1 Tax=Bradysia coprophila TaxID=38358 RepID=UPI00187D74A0|nr:threonine--tRNA ligase, cytoplasmic-like [Bradysia coprophila]